MFPSAQNPVKHESILARASVVEDRVKLMFIIFVAVDGAFPVEKRITPLCGPECHTIHASGACGSMARDSMTRNSAALQVYPTNRATSR